MTSTYEYKKTGLVSTLIYIGLILYILFYFGFSTPLPLPAEQGILVNFGDNLTGSGPEEPKLNEVATPLSAKQQEETKAEEPEKGTLTQNYEEAPSLNLKETKKTEKKKKETPVVKKETVKKTQPKTEPEPEKPKVNPLALYPAKGNTDNSKNNEGITNGKGNQGNPSGSPDSKNYTNAMSSGAGIVPNLNGRVATSLPIPEYRSQEEGQVVVNIWVDKDGNVTQAEAGAKGSTTTDPTLLNAAKKAALQAKFNLKSDAPILQKGSITYKFRLQ